MHFSHKYAGIGGGHGGAGGTIEISGGRVEGHGHEAFGKGSDACDSGKLTPGDSIWAGENVSLFPYAQRYEKARNPIAYLIARS